MFFVAWTSFSRVSWKVELWHIYSFFERFLLLMFFLLVVFVSRLALLPCLVWIWFPFVVLLTMEIALTSTRKVNKDISGDWVDQDILRTVSAFVSEGVLDHTSIDVDPSSDLRVFPPYGDKRISSQYDGWVIPLHECLFYLFGFFLSFNVFEISVMNHLMISPS